MSFLKITDPSKRAAIVNEYLKLKKSIQQNSLSEKLGDSDLQRDLIKLYKPITESQAGIAKELSDTSTVLKALPATISSSLQAIMPPPDPFSQYPSIEAFETSYQEYGPLATKYLRRHGARRKVVDKVVDKVFGIRTEDDGREYIGPTRITIDGDDVTVGEKTYKGTPGLWELLTKNMPENYNSNDLENYANILVKTKAMRKSEYQPNSPKSSTGYKYNNIIKILWVKTKSGTTYIEPGAFKSLPMFKTTDEAGIAPKTTGKADIAPTTTGEGVTEPIILSSDPNELVKMLSLRMPAYEAGNTGAGNEAVAICDELFRQGVIDKKTYKKYMTDLSR